MSFKVPESPASSTGSYRSIIDSPSSVAGLSKKMADNKVSSQMPQGQLVKQATRDIILPRWDGRKESYATFKFKLELKIEELEQYMGSNKLICLGILESLPENKQNRVSSWLMKQGKLGNYDWREFLKVLDGQFDNKLAGLEAGIILVRMKQGEHQYFDDFVQDFEYQLSLCQGETFGSAAKLILLHAAINEQTRDALIGNNITLEMGYDDYVSKTRLVASQIQARQRYRPMGTHLQTKTIHFPGITGAPTQVLQQPSSHQVDGNGDTIMDMLNAMSSASNRKSQVAHGSKQGKPPAPWRERGEFDSLIRKGCCVRCGKPGHIGKRCPTYSYAIRPDNVDVNFLGEENDFASESGKENP